MFNNQEIKSHSLDELVFAVPTAEIWKLLDYNDHGLIHGNQGLLKLIVQKGQFSNRRELEDDPSFKQIIPYGVISYKESFYLFRRKVGQKEKRLHNKYTLGVGGHMNPCNSNEDEEQYIIDELKRELFEEVRLLDGCLLESIEFVGFINDDTIPVSKVHIGLLYNIRVSNSDIVIRETDKLTASWVDRSNLIKFYDAMETWTRIAFDSFIK